MRQPKVEFHFDSSGSLKRKVRDLLGRKHQVKVRLRKFDQFYVMYLHHEGVRLNAGLVKPEDLIGRHDLFEAVATLKANYSFTLGSTPLRVAL